MQIQQQLKVWREKHDLSYEQAAARVGVTTSTWRRWELSADGKQPSELGMLALQRAGVIEQSEQTTK